MHNQETYPCILKVLLVYGKTLTFRDANQSDAAFILSLRTDRLKSRYLSSTSADIEAQKIWLEDYAKSTNQVYFIIEVEGKPIGTVRLYDPRDFSFCWGSWILAADAPKAASIESAMMVYAYAVDFLGFRSAHFDVRKGNRRVWKFHERFGATRIFETENDYFYSLSLEEICKSRKRYAKYLPDGISFS